MAHQITFGSVVRVSLLDPQGRNAKSRPAVVISRDEEIAEATAEGGEVWVVGITGQAGREQALEVPLQYGPEGRCRTGLRKPSIAYCGWLAKVPLSAIEERVGHVSPATMTVIATKVEQVRRPLAEPPAPEAKP